MITIHDVLYPANVDLDLNTTVLQEAILQVAASLRGDERVLDWTEFYEGLDTAKACVSATAPEGICMPHVRTDAVKSMVMSVGRSAVGIECAYASGGLHFIFVIGVPVARAADYLRIVGALARVFKNAQSQQQLREAKTAEAFIAILARGAMQL